MPACLCRRRWRPRSSARDFSIKAPCLPVIPGAQPLPQAAGGMGSDDWRNVGEMLGKFAAAGLRHPDLNANNILMDAGGKFWLLDFDRAWIADNAFDPGPMIGRLQRSMRKLGIAHDEAALWQAVYD